jgi:predicted GTPase
MFTEEQQVDRDEYVKCLIYGQSGAGKTTFSCTFPNTILIDFEKGKGKNKPALQVIIEEYTELEKQAIEESEVFVKQADQRVASQPAT